MKKYTHKEIIELFRNFPQTIKSMTLSTVNNNASPLTSYSPFVMDNNKFYVVMSSSMPHFKNIEDNKIAHAFIIEDEKDASHIFARKRLYFQSSCQVVDKNDHYNLFEKRFGDELKFIKEMDDFKIIELSPKEQSLILGFGAAYKMDENGKLSQKSISHK